MSISVPGYDVGIDWDAAFRQYAPAVRGFVRSRVPAACVDDAVQDTFERAYRSRHRFDASRPVWPWLVTIAKRACIEARRGRAREPVVDVRPDHLVSHADPYHELERRLQAGAISEALAGLTPRHRRLLVEWEIEGRPFNLLAADEGLTRQALKSAICRARSGFRAGYASVAERTGLAAFAFGRLCGRLRDRMQAVSPTAEVFLGGVVVGMATAAAFLVAGPIGESEAAQPEFVVPAAASSTQAAPVLDVPSPVGGQSDDGASGSQPAPPPSSPVAPGGRRASLVPSAGSDADVKVTPAGSEAVVSLYWQEESTGGYAYARVTVQCTGVVSDAACLLIRSTPQSD